jgi:hypothetical protein
MGLVATVMTPKPAGQPCAASDGDRLRVVSMQGGRVVIRDGSIQAADGDVRALQDLASGR